jgi:hypothetical protein
VILLRFSFFSFSYVGFFDRMSSSPEPVNLNFPRQKTNAISGFSDYFCGGRRRAVDVHQSLVSRFSNLLVKYSRPNNGATSRVNLSNVTNCAFSVEQQY